MTVFSKMIIAMSMGGSAEALLRKHQKSDSVDCTKSASYGEVGCKSLAMFTQKGAKCGSKKVKASSDCASLCCEEAGSITNAMCKDFNKDKPKVKTTTKAKLSSSSSFLQSKPTTIDCTSDKIFGDSVGGSGSFGYGIADDVEAVFKACCEEEADKGYYSKSTSGIYR